MSLLVPDYASSSEDEAAPRVPAPTPSVASVASVASPSPSSKPVKTAASSAANEPKRPRKTRKKTRTTLYLPPEIQRLLETGASADLTDSDDDGELLARHKRAKKAASKRSRPTEQEQTKDSVLAFLPPPKHELPVADTGTRVAVTVKEKEVEYAQETQTQEGGAEVNAAAWQQYYQQQQYQAGYAAGPDYYVGQGEEDVPGGSSKRRRTRERDIERALQQGHFETVAGQITEVQGPAPNAWQPPDDELTGANGSSEQDVKVKASFWNAQAGTRVASVKPSRLQRQKHQLNQLAFDAKARDFELLNQRGASLKTKRETYAKYGW